MRRYVLRSATAPAAPPPPAALPPPKPSATVDMLLEEALAQRKRKGADDTDAVVDVVGDAAPLSAPPPSVAAPAAPILIVEESEARPAQPVHPFFQRKARNKPAAAATATAAAEAAPLSLSVAGTGGPVHAFFTARAHSLTSLPSRAPVVHVAPPPLFGHVTQSAPAAAPEARGVRGLELDTEEAWAAHSALAAVASVPRAALMPGLYEAARAEREGEGAGGADLARTSSPSLLFTDASEEALFEQILQLAPSASMSREAARGLLQRLKAGARARGSDLLSDALQPRAPGEVLGAPALDASRSVIVTGPTGCGKSALVATLRGAHYLEIPACTNRDRGAVMRSVEEATQSQAVGAEGGTALVFEEVDLVFDADRHFHAALSALLAASKVPILLTAARLPASLRLPPHVRHVDLPRPAPADVLLYGLLAWLALGAPGPLHVAHAALLPAARRADFRAALATLSVPLPALAPPAPAPPLPLDAPAALAAAPDSAAAVAARLRLLASLADAASALDVLNSHVDACAAAAVTAATPPGAPDAPPPFFLADPPPHEPDATLAGALAAAFDALVAGASSLAAPRRPSSRWRADAAELRQLLSAVSGHARPDAVLLGEACAAICAAEALRRTAAARRRFLHYLHRSASAHEVAALEARLQWPPLPASLLPPPSPPPPAAPDAQLPDAPPAPAADAAAADPAASMPAPASAASAPPGDPLVGTPTPPPLDQAPSSPPPAAPIDFFAAPADGPAGCDAATTGEAAVSAGHAANNT